MHNIEYQNHKTVHLERQTGWTRVIRKQKGTTLAKTAMTNNVHRTINVVSPLALPRTTGSK